MLEPKVLLLDELTGCIQLSIIKDIAKVLNEKNMRDITIIVSEQVLSLRWMLRFAFLSSLEGRLIYEESRANVDTAKISSYLAV